MLNSTDAYKKAVVGTVRHVLLRSEVNIISPDLVYGVGESSGQTDFAKLEQLHDSETKTVPVATLELNRWLLDGRMITVPENQSEIEGEHAYVSDIICDQNGIFSPEPWVELRFSGVAVLQYCSVYFPDAAVNGLPQNFTVAIMSGGAAVYTETFTNNMDDTVSVSGFTVNSPDAIRVTVSKWSMPYTRMRVSDIYPGLRMRWEEKSIANFNVVQQSNFAMTTLPFGTFMLEINNSDRKFDPRNKNSLFLSMQERIGIDAYIGVDLGESVEYKRLGTYYLRDGGWSTGKNGLTLKWDMVDIIGLLSDRNFVVPDVLPTTCDGWISAIVSQLGESFAKKYEVSPAIVNVPLTVKSADSVNGKTCGDLLKWVCQATSSWARAASETGFLTIGGFWNNGNQLHLNALNDYPAMQSNNDIAYIDFTLSDGTKITLSGNNSSSENNLSIQNPFLHTTEQAIATAKNILYTYGGNIIETVGRGDPSSEIGDVDTIWLDRGNSATGRRMMQTFQLQNGVLQACQSKFLQADGAFLFENMEIITKSGTWEAPEGAAELRLIIIGGGNGGQAGTDGEYGGTMWDKGTAGDNGVNGLGAFVNDITISISSGQSFIVNIGKGGAGGIAPGGFGGEGTETTFGTFSSNNGKYFPLGYTDITSGNSYARTAVSAPKNNTGDGGKGGKGGRMGYREFRELDSEPGYYPTYGYVTIVEPGKGEPGVSGADGCVVVYWNKEK